MSRHAPPFLLSVLGGPNAGAQAELSGRQITLGSGPDDDIRLDGLPAGALRLALSGETAALRPGGGAVAHLRGGVALDPLHATRLRLPVILALGPTGAGGQVRDPGETEIHICRAAPAGTRPGLRRTGRLVAASLVFAGGLLVSIETDALSRAAASIRLADLASATTAPAPAPADDVPAFAPPSATAGPAAVPSGAPPACPDCPAQAADALRALVADAPLGPVEVAVDGDILRVTTAGIVAGDDRWRTIRRAYDEAWGARVPLVMQMTRADLKAPFAIASVWLGTPAEVVTRDGQTLRVGQRTSDGWTVTEIASGRVGVARGQDRLRIEF